MKLAYLDDETYFLDEMNRAFELYLETHPGAFSYQLFSNIEEFLFSLSDFDVFFLDIHLKESTGIDIAKKIREQLGQVDIIFVTSDPSHVFDGFQLQAKNYLLKPIQQEQVFFCLDMIREQDESSLLIQVDGATKRILINDIEWIESDGHYVIIHADEEYRYKEKLDNMKDVLPNCFVKTHRSYYVNITKVSQMYKDYLIINDIQIPISRNSYKEVYQAFIQYYKEVEL